MSVVFAAHIKAQRKVIAIAGSIAVCIGMAHAQVPTPDPTSELKRQQQRDDAARQRQLPEVDVRLQAETMKDKVSDTSKKLITDEVPCFTIKKIELTGADANTFQWLYPSLSGQDGHDDPVGKCLGVSSVNVLLDRLQHKLLEAGLSTTRALAAPQDISSGVLAISIIAGRIREIRYKTELNTRTPSLVTLPLRQGRMLELSDLEQALENLKRIPTAEAEINIEPGKIPGESDLVISYARKSPFRGSLSIDDSGSKATGKLLGALSLSYDNPLALNDLLNINLNRSIGGKSSAGRSGTQGYSLQYSMPLGYWTFSVSANANDYRQTVAGLSQTYIYSGASSSADARISRLIHRSATAKTTITARAFNRQSKNLIDDTEVEVQRRRVAGWELGASHKQFISKAVLDASLNIKRGTGAFGAISAPEEPFGEGTSRFRILTTEINVSAPFKLGQKGIRWSSQWRAQWNQTPLTPQDRFSIGGRYSVRGFDGENSLSAERGSTLRNELAVDLDIPLHEVYVALDHGRVGGLSSQLLAGKKLLGAALGIRGSYAKAQYELFIGRPLSKPQGLETSKTTAGFSLNFNF
jgi:hemolysin activation/secretion protein